MEQGQRARWEEGDLAQRRSEEEAQDRYVDMFRENKAEDRMTRGVVAGEVQLGRAVESSDEVEEVRLEAVRLEFVRVEEVRKEVREVRDYSSDSRPEGGRIDEPPHMWQ
jgi:hypothetical protein